MDFHFLIRNGIVGFIFLSTFLVTVAILDPTLAEQVVRAAGKDMAALITFGVAPVLGMLIQSTFIILNEVLGVFFWRDRKLFNDPARQLIRDAVSTKLGAPEGDVAAMATNGREEEAGLQGFRRGLLPELKEPFTHPDQIFVAVYHTRAPVQLIEWARRRRTYYYLGATGIVATVLGCALGLVFIPYVRNASVPGFISDQITRIGDADLLTTLLLGTAVLLPLSGIIWLTRRMKWDADRMELAWALIETDDHARRTLFDVPDPPAASAATAIPRP